LLLPHLSSYADPYDVPLSIEMKDRQSNCRWYRFTPDWFCVGSLAAVLLVLLADRLELCGLTRGSGWNVLLALTVVCLGYSCGLLCFGAGLLLRQRPRFSLKSLFVLTATVAIMGSWFAAKRRQADRQKEAVRTIHEFRGLGGGVTYDPEIPSTPYWGQAQPPTTCTQIIAEWCRKVIGTDFLSPVVAVRLTEAQDAGLVHLKKLTDLEELTLRLTQVTDTGLVHLKDLPKLRCLRLGATGVTDGGLVHLKDLTNLERLELSFNQITDAGLEHLDELSNLQELCLDSTDVTDAGLTSLKELTSLEQLYLTDTRVTEDGAKELHQALPRCAIWR